MPENGRTGLYNPRMGGRQDLHDRTVQFSRRPIQPHVRRSIDGLVTTEKKTTISQSPSFHTNRRANHSESYLRPAIPRQTKSTVLARHMVTKQKKKRTRRKLRLPRLSLTSAVLILIILAGSTSIAYFAMKENGETVMSASVLSSSIDNEDKPIEDEPTPEVLAAYSVAPDMPRYVRIPRLNIFARVKEIGATSNGALRTTSNIHDTGWYQRSSKPRSAGGTSVINGYVHGATKPGVFYRLGSLKEGDTVELERGDGQVLTYKVVALEFVDHDKIDMSKLLSSAEQGKSALNLITYTDRFDIKTNKYEQRTIVYTILQ